ncbi:SnoaL-like domain protein [Roseovarius albus]|uniref:SnoaL-like domain protein n=1 Tax=Roseovarius albus TaxID=1247867 RepID=A0A1X6ZJS8_9RHOB|nr:nuclear transport factor 2 family protein [Roseovarius albus]SLN53265.1 SnoaL-like domain protein [Roseovarius albus]
MTGTIEAAAQSKLNQWKAAFNGGDAAGCASCYEQDALMVVTPFGEFKGREAIEAFWQDLIGKGFSEVSYTDVKVEVVDEKSVVISASWSMNNAHGIITKELWVLQEDGNALLREDHFEVQG